MHPLCPLDRMRCAKVAVHTYRQGAAIAVTDPAGCGCDVNARFNAAGHKEVAKVVVGYSRHFSDAAGSCQRSFTFCNQANIVSRLWIPSFQPFEQDAHIRDYGNMPQVVPVLSHALFCIADSHHPVGSPRRPGLLAAVRKCDNRRKPKKRT